MKNTTLALNKWFLLGLFFLMSFTTKQTENKLSVRSYHPFHVSVFEVNYNGKDSALQVTCKLISEDLESILRTKNGGTVDLATLPDKAKNEQMINAYFQQNLSIKLDGAPVALKLVGFEKEKESVYAYFEAKNLSSPKKIEIKNTVLYDLTKDQAQIVHMVVAGKRQSKKLNYPNSSLSFDY